MVLVFFIMIAITISIIDYKKRVVPDRIILPAIIILIAMKWFENSLNTESFIAVAIIVVIFFIPIALGMAFGGGDVRYGVFCALFVSLKGVGLFLIFSGLFHLIVLKVLGKKVFGFAPAMSLGALSAYMIGIA